MINLIIGGAAVGGLLTAGAIGARNKAAVQAFEAKNAAYTMQQYENNIRVYEAIEEARRAGALQIIEDKAAIPEMIGKETIRRGEGVTAGNSVARGIQALTIKTETAINKEMSNIRRNVINMWQQHETINNQLQQAKIQAYHEAKANITTGIESLMQITQGALSGALAGAVIRNAMIP